MKLTFHLSSDRGVAIVAVAMVMVVGALLGAAIITQTSQDIQLTDRTYSDKQALYLAESGKERAYREIMNDDNFTTLGNPAVLNNVSVGGGTFDLTATTLSESPKVVRLVSTGRTAVDQSQITVVAEVIRENVNVWNNALFGGAGQVGGVINGNCAIHGSVHLLGEGVAAGNPSIEALDLSGASLIHNNYVGIPATLLAKLPPLPTTVFGGETIESLDAKLRVKNGAVGVSGSSEIGEANIVGNDYKETMDGIYIETDGTETRWTGNQVVGGVPNPDSVQSDNGTEALYDLGDIVEMPDLTDPYTDPISGISYASYEAYFVSQALTLPPLTLDDSTAGVLAIQAAIAGGTLDPAMVTINGDEFTITDGTNIIHYDPTAPEGGARLDITGMIHVDGNLVVGEKNLDITYSGKGTIFAGIVGSNTGTVDVHSNLLPVGTFPITDVLGLMAKVDLNMADGPGDSNLIMAGAFFAGNQALSTKQNQIAGTFVCNYYDMGTNVPKIYQVPALVDNLPPGMIGSDPIWVVTGFQERSWQID